MQKFWRCFLKFVWRIMQEIYKNWYKFILLILNLTMQRLIGDYSKSMRELFNESKCLHIDLYAPLTLHNLMICLYFSPRLCNLSIEAVIHKKTHYLISFLWKCCLNEFWFDAKIFCCILFLLGVFIIVGYLLLFIISKTETLKL